MGFVGGGGNIAIVNALPLLIFVLIVFKYSLVYGICSSYFLRLLEIRFLDVAPGGLFQVPAEYSAELRGAYPGA